MRGIDPAAVWPDKRLARARFDAAASNFEHSAFVHAQARERLLERLDYLPVQPDVILDLGCGVGTSAAALATRFPDAAVLAVDASLGMLTEAARTDCGAALIAADVESLPLPDRSIDLAFANLVLPWCHPELAVAEIARVLRAGGLLLLSTVGPDTLAELRHAWRQVDDRVHVHAFIDMHDVGDMLARHGLADPVLDVDRLTVTWESAAAMYGELRAAGARNAAAGRSRGMTSRSRWQRFESALESQRRDDGRLAVSVELILAQARGGSPRTGRPIEVPLDRVGRR